eukprot:TRINITY_DN120_c1_g4_i1.p1 TRINITY_DN120_c1_g4~~TRINITY_DN120_c1_g4_i1.p1  ORF type:complete len:4230 (+),score=1221.81 TRINITY_DN120_c1_g4_i1:145-12834(+)
MMRRGAAALLLPLIAAGAGGTAPCAPLTPSTAASGLRVRRGPDWRWKDQDGGPGAVGRLVKAADKCKGGEWWRVSWDGTSFQNAYRVGCEGKYDLVPAGCESLSAPPPSCAFDQLRPPAGAVVTGGAPGCKEGGSVPVGATCSWGQQRHSCAESRCEGPGRWSARRPSCVLAEPGQGQEKGPCRYDALLPVLRGATPVAGANSSGGCRRGGEVAPGAACELAAPDGARCGSARCAAGGAWRLGRLEQKCGGTAPEPGRSCPFDALSAPPNATAVGEGCEKGGLVAPGRSCRFEKQRHSCDTPQCKGDGVWSSAEPSCAPDGCLFALLRAPRAAAPSGDGCKQGGVVPRGSFCTFEKKGFVCDVAVCASDGAWGASAVACDPVPSAQQAASGTGSDCQPGIQYNSNNPGNANLEDTYRMSEDPEGCASECAGAAGCKCFTWNGQNGRCWLMTSCGNPTPRPPEFRMVSGEAGCRMPNDADFEQGSAAPDRCRLAGDAVREGLRVVRGADWKWGDQSNTRGEGTVTSRGDACKGGVWARVKWDSGHENDYRAGCDSAYDLSLAGCLRGGCRLAGEEAAPGVAVVRGPDWQWRNQDGQGAGVVLWREADCPGGHWVRVRWEATGIENNYRVGCGGRSDLAPADGCGSGTGPTTRARGGRGGGRGAGRGLGHFGRSAPAGRGGRGRGAGGRGAEGTAAAAASAPRLGLLFQEVNRATAIYDCQERSEPGPGSREMFRVDAVGDLSACIAYCKDSDDCTAVHYSAEERRCGVYGSMVPQSGAGRACSRRPAASQPPLASGFQQGRAERACAGAEAPLAVLDGVDLAGCLRDCAERGDCAAAGYHPARRRCELGSHRRCEATTDGPGWQLHERDAEAARAVQDVLRSVSCSRDTAFAGDEVHTVPAQEHTACLRLCAAAPECAATVYQDHTCRLLATVQPGSPTSGALSCIRGSDARPQSKAPAYQCTSQSNFAGGDLFQFSDVYIRDDCAHYCTKVPECVAFVYRTGYCTLKAFVTYLEVAAVADVDVCVRTPEAPAGGYVCQADSAAAGIDLLSFPGVADIDQCQQLCDGVGRGACSAVTFEGGRCVLKAATGGKAPVSSAGSTLCSRQQPEGDEVDRELLFAVGRHKRRRAAQLGVTYTEVESSGNWRKLQGSDDSVMYKNVVTDVTTSERPVGFGYSCQKDSNLPSGDLFRLVGVHTVRECEQVCEQVPYCVAYVHRGACPPGVNAVKRPKPPIAKCKTCDIKGYAHGGFIADSEWRDTTACKKNNPTFGQALPTRVRVTLAVTFDCVNQDFPANQLLGELVALMPAGVRARQPGLDSVRCCDPGPIQQPHCKTITIPATAPAPSGKPPKAGVETEVVISFPCAETCEDDAGDVKDAIVNGTQTENVTSVDSEVVIVTPQENATCGSLSEADCGIVLPFCSWRTDKCLPEPCIPHTDLGADALLQTHIATAFRKCQENCGLRLDCIALTYNPHLEGGLCKLFGSAVNIVYNADTSMCISAPRTMLPEPPGPGTVGSGTPSRLSVRASVLLPMTRDQFLEIRGDFAAHVAAFLQQHGVPGVTKEGILVTASTVGDESGGGEGLQHRRSRVLAAAGTAVEVRLAVAGGEARPGALQAAKDAAVAQAAVLALRKLQPRRYACSSDSSFETSGALRVLPDVAGAGDCLQRCTAHEGCAKVVLDEDGRCVLLRASAERAPVRAGEAVVACEHDSSKRDKGEPVSFDCEEGGSYLGGDLLVVENVPSADACKALCAELSAECDLAVYGSDGTCMLKAAGEAAEVRDPDIAGLACHAVRGGAAPAMYDCRPGSFVGGNLFALDGVRNVRKCQEACSALDQCSVIVHDPSGRCMLKSAEAAHEPDPAGWRAGAIACRRREAIPQEMLVEIEAYNRSFRCTAAGWRDGSIMAVAGVPSQGDCLAHCLLIHNCEAAVYFRNGTCELKSADATPALAPPDQVAACSRARSPTVAPDAAPWPCVDRSSSGGDLFVMEGVTNSRNCLVQCAALPSCQKFVYDQGTCLLKGDGAAPAGEPSSAVTCSRPVSPAGTAFPCTCLAQWDGEPEDGPGCAAQRGCPSRACDSSARRWCRVAAPGCATEQRGGWAFCGDETRVESRGRRGRVLDAAEKDQRSKDGKIWSMEFDHILWINGLTPEVFQGAKAPPGAADAPADPLLVKTRILAVPGTLTHPDASNWLEVFRAVTFELQKANSHFRSALNPVLTVEGVGLLGDDNWGILSTPKPAFHQRLPLAKLLLDLELDQDADVNSADTRQSLKAALARVLKADVGLFDIPRVELCYRTDPSDPDICRTTWQCTLRGLYDGCLDNPGSTEGRRAAAAAAHVALNSKRPPGAPCRDSDATGFTVAGEPASCGQLARMCAQSSEVQEVCPETCGQCGAARTGSTQAQSALESYVRVNATCQIQYSGDLSWPDGRLEFLVDAVSAANMAVRQDIQEAQHLSAFSVTDARVSLWIEPFKTFPIEGTLPPGVEVHALSTPAPSTGAPLPVVVDSQGDFQGGAGNETVQELPPADAEGSSAPAARRLLQFGPRASTPMVPAGLLGLRSSGRDAAADPAARAHGDWAARAERLLQQPGQRRAARRGGGLQFAAGVGKRTGDAPASAPACTTGPMGTEYGLLSNLYNLDDSQPLAGLTLAQCADACRANPACSAFTRKNIGSADQDPAACYLKNTLLSLAGDQVATDGWGTYAVRCREVKPCSWVQLDNVALHLAEEHVQPHPVTTAAECKNACEGLSECLGVSFDTAGQKCYFVHLDESARAQRTGYTSYVCRRGGGSLNSCPDGDHGCNAGEGSACYEVGSKGFMCGCQAGYHCYHHCSDPHVPHLCAPDTCLYKMVGMLAEEGLKEIHAHQKYASLDERSKEGIELALNAGGGAADCSTTCEQLQEWLGQISLGALPEGMARYVLLAMVECKELAAVGPTAPIRAAWMEAFARTVNTLAYTLGSGYYIDVTDVQSAPSIEVAAVKDATGMGAVVGSTVDVTIEVVPVHSQKHHRVVVELLGTSVKDLLAGEGATGTPLEGMLEEMAWVDGFSQNGLGVLKLCLVQESTGSDLACFDQKGNLITPPGGGTVSQTTVCELNAKERGGHTREKIAWFECDEGHTLHFMDSFWGRASCVNELCFADPSAIPEGETRTNCHADYCSGNMCSCKGSRTLEILQDLCEGEQSCLVDASPDVFGDPCVGETKYLWAKYTCLTAGAEASRRSQTLDDVEEEQQCAGGGCSTRLMLDVQLEQVNNVRVINLPDGTKQQLMPEEPLPTGYNVVETIVPDGVNPQKLESVVGNNVIQDAMDTQGLAYVSEGVEAVLLASGAHVVELAQIPGATFSGACHEDTTSPAVDCTKGYCAAEAGRASHVVHTACVGSPLCGPADCNDAGEASGYKGSCKCLCRRGYIGATCDACQMGWTGWPTCRDLRAADISQPGGSVPVPNVEEWRNDAQYFQIALSASVARVQEQWRELHDAVYASAQAAGGAIAVLLTYACPADICTPECPPGRVADWTLLQRSQCVALQNAPLRRLAAALAADAEIGSIAEVGVLFPPGTDRADALARALRALSLRAATPNSTLAELGYFGATPINWRMYAAAEDGSNESLWSRFMGQPTAWIAIAGIALAAIIAGVALFYWMRRRRALRLGAEEDRLVIQKEPMEAMGIEWEGHTTLREVRVGSAADRAGAGRFVGRRVVLVNGVPVKLLSDIRDQATGVSVVVLTFEPVSFLVQILLGYGAADFDAVTCAELLAELLQFERRQVEIVDVEDGEDSVLVTVRFAGGGDEVMRVLQQLRSRGGAVAKVLPVVDAQLVANDPFGYGRPRGAGSSLSGSSGSQNRSHSAGSDSSAVDSGIDLWVLCQWAPVPLAEASGPYTRHGASVNGYPVWARLGGGWWLYSTPKGHWSLTSAQSDFLSGGGVVATRRRHRGTPPEQGNHAWRGADGRDITITVAQRRPRVHGFEVGELVVCCGDVTQGGSTVAALGETGWVKGHAQQSDGVRVHFPASGCDVAVLPEEIDRAQGPAVAVLGPEGGWREAMVTNATPESLKVHYIGYAHEYDEWVPRDAAAVRRRGFDVAVGDVVMLRGDYSGLAGSLRPGELGTVVQDAGLEFLRPFLVRGPRGDSSWFSAEALTEIPGGAPRGSRPAEHEDGASSIAPSDSASQAVQGRRAQLRQRALEVVSRPLSEALAADPKFREQFENQFDAATQAQWRQLWGPQHPELLQNIAECIEAGMLRGYPPRDSRH